MELPLAGRTALVTGAAKRTGRVIAETLARAGADVAIHYHHSRAEAEGVLSKVLALGRKGMLVQADFSNLGAAGTLVAEVQETLGSLDILINNVGNYPEVAPLAQTEREFAHTLDTNLVAPYALIRAAVPVMKRAAQADVINLGYAGTEHVLSNRHAMSYQISKTGLLVMTRTLAEELGSWGVRVNMVSPGHLDNSVDLPDHIDRHVPLGRAGRPEEVAEAIIYLLTKGRYITGANIELAGGYRLSLSRELERANH